LRGNFLYFGLLTYAHDEIFTGRSVFCLLSTGAGTRLSYYLPDSLQYNPAIPKPKDIITTR
jgi:hypothetical protein